MYLTGQANPKFKFPNNQDIKSFNFCALVIRICFGFRLPARSRFGEGRDFVLRV